MIAKLFLTCIDRKQQKFGTMHQWGCSRGRMRKDIKERMSSPTKVSLFFTGIIQPESLSCINKDTRMTMYWLTGTTICSANFTKSQSKFKAPGNRNSNVCSHVNGRSLCSLCVDTYHVRDIGHVESIATKSWRMFPRYKKLCTLHCDTLNKQTLPLWHLSDSTSCWQQEWVFIV